MRSHEECVADVLRAVDREKLRRRARLNRGLAAGAGMLGIACILLLAVMLSGVLPTPVGVEEAQPWQEMAAAVLARGTSFGYALMGFVGMVFGAALTLLVVRLREHTAPSPRLGQADGNERPC